MAMAVAWKEAILSDIDARIAAKPERPPQVPTEEKTGIYQFKPPANCILKPYFGQKKIERATGLFPL